MLLLIAHFFTLLLFESVNKVVCLTARTTTGRIQIIRVHQWEIGKISGLLGAPYSSVKDDIEYERFSNIFCRDLKKLGVTKTGGRQQAPQETLAKGMRKRNPVSLLWQRLWFFKVDLC